MPREFTPIAGLRFEYDGIEAMLDGPPDALRELATVLRNHADEPVEVQLVGNLARVKQLPQPGPLRISVVSAGTTLTIEGDPASLNIFWSALEGTAAASEEVRNAPVRQHTHIEYLGESDEYRSPGSVPLMIGADWPTG